MKIKQGHAGLQYNVLVNEKKERSGERSGQRETLTIRKWTNETY